MGVARESYGYLCFTSHDADYVVCWFGVFFLWLLQRYISLYFVRRRATLLEQVIFFPAGTSSLLEPAFGVLSSTTPRTMADGKYFSNLSFWHHACVGVTFAVG